MTTTTNLSQYLTHPVFRILSQVAEETGVETYVIGGYVRDLLLHGEASLPKDIDVVVVGSGIEMAGLVRAKLEGEVHFTVYKNFGTAMVRWGDTELEFVGARKESYRRDSRKPIVENGSLEDDQNRRDFTINALAISLNPQNLGQLIDPFGGMNHLKEGLILTPLDPGRTFSDDPLRMLRGIRFASRFDFRIGESTFQAIIKHKERIGIISQERITEGTE
jgi:poly(A) polymerase